MTKKAVTKMYRGILGDANEVQVYPVGGEPYQLRHIVYHSPTGFAWGYGGSGPADLPLNAGDAIPLSAGDAIALSILADHLNEHPDDHAPWRGNPQCWRYHQPFKWDFVANWPMDAPFELDSEDIDAWLGAAMLAKRRQEEDGWLEEAYEDSNGCGLEE